MRIDILRLLTDDYVSGEDISRKLGISRAAVWKNIHALKEDGGVVEAKTNAGYKLVRLPDVLRPEYVCLHSSKPCAEVFWLESVDSTNNYAKRLARDGVQGGAVVIAEHQEGGKGRLGRQWDSKPGEAVQMSFIVRPENLAPAKAPAFNFAAALGVCSAIRRVCGVDALIKWPNDVVYQGKKLCGILTEMSADMDHIEYVVCGVGVNVNQQSFPAELASRAVSLRMVTGKKADRVRLCTALMEEVETKFAEFLAGGLEAIIGEYTDKSAILGKEVLVKSASGDFQGTCQGFGSNGELRVVAQDGEERQFHEGEVSVRGVSDYV